MCRIRKKNECKISDSYKNESEYKKLCTKLFHFIGYFGGMGKG